MTAWLLYVLVVGALLTIAAHCVEHVCRVAGRPTRWAWIGAPVLLVVLASVAPFRMTTPAAPTPMPAPIAMAIESGRVFAEHPTPTNASQLEAFYRTVTTTMDQTLMAVQRHVVPFERYFLPVWIALTALLGALFTGVYFRIRRMQRAWPVADLQGVRVRIAPRTGPMVIGLVQPEIVIPAWLLHRRAEEQQVVLAHEREHLRAGDSPLLAAGCAIAALFPWHPAVWWMLSRLRLAVEVDCDTRVLRRGVTPTAYGTLLIEVAEQCSTLPFGAPALADTASHLKKRLLAMNIRPTRFARVSGVFLGAIALGTIVAACATQVPRATQNDSASPQPIASQTDTDIRDSLAVLAARVRVLESRERGQDREQIEGLQAQLQQALEKIEIMAKTKPVAAWDTQLRSDSVMRQQLRTLEEVDFKEVSKVKGLVTAKRDSIDTVSILLRGTSSIQSGRDPIVIVDGARVPRSTNSLSPLDQIDPSIIDKIEVFKGPSAARLYGADAANGVIVITTKRPKGQSKNTE